MGGLALVTSGDQVLERLGLEGQSCGRCLARLGTVLGAEVGVALLGLALTRPRFQRLEGRDSAGPTSETDDADGDEHG